QEKRILRNSYGKLPRENDRLNLLTVCSREPALVQSIAANAAEGTVDSTTMHRGGRKQVGVGVFSEVVRTTVRESEAGGACGSFELPLFLVLSHAYIIRAPPAPRYLLGDDELNKLLALNECRGEPPA